VPSEPSSAAAATPCPHGSFGAPATEAEVFAEIQRILFAELYPPRAVRREDSLLKDLQLDSLTLTVLAVGLEDRFRIHLLPEASDGIETVGDLAGWVFRRTQEEGRGA
jgi:acyl carrier protein